MSSLVVPTWRAPNNIKAFATTIAYGTSTKMEKYHNSLQLDSNNLNQYQKMYHDINLPSKPLWLDQQHSSIAIDATEFVPNTKADATISKEPNTVCVVQTADCLPILICNTAGTFVGAIHAGWKGLYSNIITSTIMKSKINGSELIAWIGPSIAQDHYQVQQDFYDRFTNLDSEYEQCFYFNKELNCWYANLKLMATIQLEQLGIENIIISPNCTYSQTDTFYSYRKNGTTSRISSMIWFE